MLNRYSISIILSITLLLPFISADAWLFGTINTNDIYVYDICDYISIDRNTMASNNCHTMTISVLDRLQSSHGDVFLLHTMINNSNSITYDILELDAESYNTYGVTGSNYHAQTLKHTILWMHETARLKHIDLQVSQDVRGDYVSGVITEYDGNIAKIILEGSLHKGTIHIDKDIGLPIYGDIQSANTRTERNLFTFELIDQDIRMKEQTINVPPSDITPPINILPPITNDTSNMTSFNVPGEMIDGVFHSYESNYFVENPDVFGVPGEMINGEFIPFDITVPIDTFPEPVNNFNNTVNATLPVNNTDIDISEYGLDVKVDLSKLTPPTTKEEYDYISELLSKESDPERKDQLNQLLIESEYTPYDQRLTEEEYKNIINDLEIQLADTIDPEERANLEAYIMSLKADYDDETVNEINNDMPLNTVEDYNNRIAELERLIPESTPDEQSMILEEINKLRNEREMLKSTPQQDQDFFSTLISEIQRFFNEVLNLGSIFSFQ